jgi:SSS family solute:Na+ symporter
MTLYQRIFACRSKKDAQRAWFFAGLFEWPIMALMGVVLGMFARVAVENGMFAEMGLTDASAMDAEMGLPLLLKTVLPVGLMGLMMSAYFSAIMSTADSCLMAASGNLVTDILESIFKFKLDDKRQLRLSQLTTLIIGIIALIIASMMQNVLELMLYSYAFMVSGLLVPVIGAMFWPRSSSIAAFFAMIIGGFTTTFLSLMGWPMPFGLDPNFFGISASALIFVSLSLIFPNRNPKLNYKTASA